MNRKLKFARLSAAATILETANLASEKCGVSLDWDAVMATSEEEGITDEVIESPTFKFLSDYQRADAVMRYLKSPVEWCDRIWHLLGPDHPPMIKQPRGFSLALLPPLQPANDLVINAMNDRGRVAGVLNLIDHLLRRVRLTFFIFFSSLA